jgi:hypothetical protein
LIDQHVSVWLNDEYPALARQAKRERATIYWGDEMGLRSDHSVGSCYAPLGHTLVVRATGQRFGCNMISAITNRRPSGTQIRAGQTFRGGAGEAAAPHP